MLISAGDSLTSCRIRPAALGFVYYPVRRTRRTRWRPFLVDQCAAGWTSNVILLSDRIAETRKAWTHARDLRRGLHLANPGIAFLADYSVQYIGKEALDGMLRNDAFELPAMVKVSGFQEMVKCGKGGPRFVGLQKTECTICAWCYQVPGVTRRSRHRAS